MYNNNDNNSNRFKTSNSYSNSYNNRNSISTTYNPQRPLVEVSRGDILYVYRDDRQVGSEMRNGRPCVVISRDDFCKSSEVVCAVYLTSAPKEDLNTHVYLQNNRINSTALCEQIVSVSRRRLGDRIGTVSEDEMGKIDSAIAFSLNLDTGLDENSEIVRLKVERDTYKKMYDSLINRMTKK